MRVGSGGGKGKERGRRSDEGAWCIPVEILSLSPSFPPVFHGLPMSAAPEALTSRVRAMSAAPAANSDISPAQRRRGPRLADRRPRLVSLLSFSLSLSSVVPLSECASPCAASVLVRSDSISDCGREGVAVEKTRGNVKEVRQLGN